MLTAGLGTRLRPLTERFAKPAVPFLGVPLLRYPLFLMRAAGVDELVLNAHWKPEQISSLASSLEGLRVHVSHEGGAAPLGSGGGIWQARGWLDQRAIGDNDSFLVSNGDEVILPHDPSVMARFVADHRASGALATVLVMKHPLVGTQFGGVWAGPDGLVRGFGKVGADFGADAIGYHYIGLLLLQPRVFDFMPSGESNILYDVLKSAIAAGERVRVLESQFTWFETGNPVDFLAATGEALHLLDCASRGASVAASPLKDRGLRSAATCLASIVSSAWAAGTRLDHVGGALVLRAPGSSLDGAVRGFAVLESGSSVRASVENIVAMPGAVVTESCASRICL